MDDIAAAEERIVTERIRQKINEVNTAAQTQLSGVQDHVHFTLQQAYFKCAYECFDRRKKQEDIDNCVEYCSVPVLKAQNFIESEMADFQEKMNRSLMVCQDKFEAAKLQKNTSDAIKDMESCVDQSVQDNIKTLPHLVGKFKVSLGITE
ncbi:protein FAM136A-like [Solanum tuberosum]|uniref:Protein FAM136A n=1 Tax=Solanum tuberosum TaxID=4113 RepID=M1BBD3_SOLTU|nr:PREDICTED: protein FAM136A-like [Solanum tuberosum]